MPTQPSSTWVVIPTYNERDNVDPLVSAVLAALPDARVLIVDDNSPDGTGQIADRISQYTDRVQVLHRAGKEGLGAAYRAGFARVLADPTCRVVVQMDCDFSHDPRDLPRLIAAIDAGAELVLGSRYVAGGATPGWSRRRRFISRGGSRYSRIVLGVPYRDLTGGFKAWRADLLRAVVSQVRYANGYGFQVEMTYRAHRRGARIVELPISFSDRTAGTSKMSGAIVVEALVAVPRLRLAAFREGRGARDGRLRVGLDGPR